MSNTSTDAAVTKIAEDYYDSEDADLFYSLVWGGEDIHIGLYQNDDDTIKDASRKTVSAMAEKLNLTSDSKVLDIGSGYGGSARYLAKTYGCKVVCINLSSVENARNEAMTKEQGLSDLITVVHGSFEDIPKGYSDFDVVWSQDAILHSGNRQQVLKEVARVLKAGGEFIFTDPMQADTVTDTSVLQPIYDRIHLTSLASIGFYRRELDSISFEEVEVLELTHQLRTHYARVKQQLIDSQSDLEGKISTDYIERMLVGLQHWVDGADKGYLSWGILHFRKM